MLTIIACVAYAAIAVAGYIWFAQDPYMEGRQPRPVTLWIAATCWPFTAIAMIVVAFGILTHNMRAAWRA